MMKRKITNAITEWLCSFGIEPYLHIVLTDAVCIVFCAAFTAMGAHPRLLLTIAAALVVDIGKEVFDSKTGGRFDWRDLVSDDIGIALFTAAYLLR